MQGDVLFADKLDQAIDDPFPRHFVKAREDVGRLGQDAFGQTDGRSVEDTLSFPHQLGYVTGEVTYEDARIDKTGVQKLTSVTLQALRARLLERPEAPRRWARPV